MSITSEQCRAARALVAWSQDQLALASAVAKTTIANFETDKRAPYDRTLLDLQRALEAAGVEFIPENGGGVGVRLKHRRATIDQGKSPDELTSENDG
ncbi:helix-turn-helix domain-containing protein [Kaistia terrae]|uniref:Helix-turn-helix domain-containing protein n=1 Tax=Kaistia terrae TaxID=537017 RepID=A0ABW0Q2Z4_9HYPH|nr:helix-turn-helix transcriptional regulator [Kaistia terrae]MCX5581515.1 helix-turn-helix transcriptional regulator [Kaistia terrae]